MNLDVISFIFGIAITIGIICGIRVIRFDIIPSYISWFKSFKKNSKNDKQEVTKIKGFSDSSKD